MRKRSYGLLLSTVLVAAFSPAFGGTFDRVDMSTLETPLYTVEGDAFVRHNGDRYTNRPLYNNHLSAAVLAGDKPYIIAGSNKTMLGCLMVGFQRGGNAKWLLNASDITSKYRPGRFEWIVKDAAWGNTTVHLEVVPVADGPGYAARERGGCSVRRQSRLGQRRRGSGTRERTATLGRDNPERRVAVASWICADRL